MSYVGHRTRVVHRCYEENKMLSDMNLPGRYDVLRTQTFQVEGEFLVLEPEILLSD